MSPVMSAFGRKRTSLVGLHTSALEGKADIEGVLGDAGDDGAVLVRLLFTRQNPIVTLVTTGPI